MPADPNTGPLSADEQLLWDNLGRLVHLLPRALDEDMSRTSVTMTEFAILRLLEDAPGHRLRMTALADAVGLTPSRITRAVGGLSSAGLTRKERHGQDGRGNDTVMTADGLRALREASPAYLISARRRVLDQVPGDQLPGLARTIALIAASLFRPEPE